MPRGVPKSGKRKPRKKSTTPKAKPFATRKGVAKVKVGVTARGTKAGLQARAGQAVTKANRYRGRVTRLNKKKYKTNKIVVPTYKAMAKRQQKKAGKLMGKSKKAKY